MAEFRRITEPAEARRILSQLPPYIRWEQRGGARIDHVAFTAAVAHLDGVSVDAVTRLKIKRCGWCLGLCGGRRVTWCSDVCRDAFYSIAITFDFLSWLVAARDSYLCVRCGHDFDPLGQKADGYSFTRDWETDHIIPVRNGGTDDPRNLRTLCHADHVTVGYEQRAAERATTSQQVALFG